MTETTRGTRILWGVFTALCLLAGALLLGFFSLPYVQARELADALARDGSMQSLTPERFARWVGVGRGLGLALLAAAAALFGLRRGALRAIARLLRGLGSFARALWQDTCRLMARLAPTRQPRLDTLVVLAFSLLAAWLRVLQINQPMSHDEAYTIVAFATRPLWIVLSDYSLPNNHVFHSLLVHISYHLFGLQPWAMRLPVLLAGVLLVPLGYRLARMVYGRPAALVSAGLLAVTPWLVRISSDARGYVLICMFTLATLGLGLFVRREFNRAAWLLLALFSALGFHTTPTMLYPCGIVYTWLALNGLMEFVGSERKRFFKGLVGSAVLGAVLTLLLYTPIFITSGLRAITANPFVLPLSWGDFWPQLATRAVETWHNWCGAGGVWGWLLLAANLLALGLQRWISRERLPIQAAALLWLGPVLALQRPYPWTKLWSFLLPLFLIWGAGGVIALWRRWSLGLGAQRVRLDGILAGGVLVAVAVAGFMGGLSRGPQPLGEVEQSVLYLQGQLRPGDIVVIDSPDDAPLWYYFDLHAVPEEYAVDIQQRSFTRAWVLVDEREHQTLQNVWKNRGPTQTQPDWTQAQVAQRFGSLFVYQLP